MDVGYFVRLRASLIWYQVLDTGELASDCKVPAFHWNSYACQDGVVSIPNYLETHADRLRSRLLAFIYDIGALRFGGKSVIEHLEVGEGFSLWWMSLLVEKSLYKSPRLFDCLRLLALEELLQSVKPYGIEFVSNDKVLVGAIKNLCTGFGILFRWRCSPRPGDRRHHSLAERIYRLMPRQAQAVFWLARHVACRWPLRLLRKGLPAQSCGDITAFSYFIHLDTKSCSQGGFYSHQWGAVSELLNAESKETNWFHHFLQSPEVPDVHTGLSWLERFNQNTAGQGRHLFVDSFLSVGILVRSFIHFMAMNIAAWRLRNVGHCLQGDKLRTGLWLLVRNDFGESVCGVTAMHNLLWVGLLDAAIRGLPRQRQGFYLFESQGWERAMIHAWYKHGHGELVAVAHATVRYWDLRYFEDPRAFHDDSSVAMPLPDRVAVNGPVAQRTLLASGYPVQRLVGVEAQRYLWLGAADVVSSPHPKMTTDGRRRVLILGDYTRSENDAMIRLLQGGAVDLKERFEFTVKPHPSCPVSSLDYLPLVYEVTHEPLSRIFHRYDISYDSNATSASLDAFLAGMSVIVHLTPGQINLSPLRGVKGVKFVSTSEELLNALLYEESIRVGSPETEFFWLDQDLPRWRALIGYPGLPCRSSRSMCAAI